MLTGPQALQAIEILNKNKKKYRAGRYWQIYQILRKSFYKSKEWIALSRSVRQEAGCCQRNSKHIGTLHCHHVKRIWSHPHLGLTRTNLLVICVNCHDKEHRNKRSIDYHDNAWKATLSAEHEHPRLQING